MAKKVGSTKSEGSKKVTSIGSSKRSRQNNKNKKRIKKKYRGQGR